LWEALRPKDISAEERSKLVTEIMGKVSECMAMLELL
jgi:hypothetical protein